jgi:hypothetical protein
VIVNSGHLKDEQIFECYVADRTGEAVHPRSADHLAVCQKCAARYEELVGFMVGVREDAEAESDERFPAERLLAQQQQILRRIEHVNRSARVITFPGRDAGGGSRSTVPLTPRWLAAAAAAGLFIGLAVGGYFGSERLQRSTEVRSAQAAPAMSVQQTKPAAAVRVNGTEPASPDDDAFMAQLEMALARPRTRELQPFDALTPHVRDIDNRVR